MKLEKTGHFCTIVSNIKQSNISPNHNQNEFPKILALNGAVLIGFLILESYCVCDTDTDNPTDYCTVHGD